MQKAVILTDDEYAAIPLNAGMAIFSELESDGLKVVGPDGVEYEPLRHWLVGVLANNAGLLTVPWKQSQLNPERECCDQASKT